MRSKTLWDTLAILALFAAFVAFVLISGGAW